MTNKALLIISLLFVGCSSFKVKEQTQIDSDSSLILVTKQPVLGMQSTKKVFKESGINNKVSKNRKNSKILKETKKVLAPEILKPVAIIDEKPIAIVKEVLVDQDQNSSERVLGKGSSIGTFEEVEWGDYANLKISNSRGNQSFFLKGGPPLLIGELQEKLKGKRIKVSWIRVKRYVPEIDETLEVVETEDICSYSNIQIKSKMSRGLIKRCKE